VFATSPPFPSDSAPADLASRQLLPSVKAQLDFLCGKGGVRDLLSKQAGANEAMHQMRQPAQDKYLCDACGQYSLALRACSACRSARYCRWVGNLSCWVDDVSGSLTTLRFPGLAS